MNIIGASFDEKAKKKAFSGRYSNKKFAEALDKNFEKLILFERSEWKLKSEARGKTIGLWVEAIQKIRTLSSMMTDFRQ